VPAVVVKVQWQEATNVYTIWKILVPHVLEIVCSIIC